jgi:hypothetical protein
MVVQCRNPGSILSLQIFSHSSELISDRGLAKGGTKSMKTAEKVLDDIHWDPTWPVQASIYLFIGIWVIIPEIARPEEGLNRCQKAFAI